MTPIPALHCDTCGTALHDGEETVCEWCLTGERDEPDDDDPLFGTPLRRLADDMDGDNVE